MNCLETVLFNSAFTTLPHIQIYTHEHSKYVHTQTFPLSRPHNENAAQIHSTESVYRIYSPAVLYVQTRCGPSMQM